MSKAIQALSQAAIVNIEKSTARRQILLRRRYNAGVLRGEMSGAGPLAAGGAGWFGKKKKPREERRREVLKQAQRMIDESKQRQNKIQQRIDASRRRERKKAIMRKSARMTKDVKQRMRERAVRSVQQGTSYR